MSDVKTGKVTDRRTLRFSTIDDLLKDVDRLVAADRAGKLRHTGNWTAGQAMGHLATWINFAYEGYPDHPPWFIRMFLKLKRRKYITVGMDAGVRIPGIQGGTRGTEAMSTQEGADRLRKALQRLQSEPAKYGSPAWGPMSPEDRIALNLRHAELHLSFQHPG